MKRSIQQASIFLILAFFFPSILHATDTMNTSQIIRDTNTLVSAGEFFELGFFSPGNSKKWYLGIWYKNFTAQTIVWVANREAPLKSRSSGVLKIMEPTGTLVLLGDTNNTIWSSNMSKSLVVVNPILQLLDSGNLVLQDMNDAQPEKYLWQSFDYPTDTFLPGMMFGINSVYLTSWKTNEDPSPGDYEIYLDPTGYPQMFVKKGGVDLYRMGPWNGLAFSGTPEVQSDPSFTYGVLKNADGQFYIHEDSHDKSIMSRITLNTSGQTRRWRWVDQARGWVPQTSFPVDYCDTYGTCGAHGVCSIGNFPICSCLDKFEPKDLKGWAQSDWSTHGCVRRTPLNCTAGDGFVKYSNLKFPNARNSWYNESMTLEECRVKCLRNCSCMAYTTLNISDGGSGCLLYFGDLVDMRYVPIDEQYLYIRMAFSELGHVRKENVKLIASIAMIGAALLLLGLSVGLCIWKRKKNEKGRSTGSHDEELELPLFNPELPLFDFLTISKATDKFSSQNRIGEGGYGPVYKGTLKDGQDIAVKRLSKNSQQGLDEFKNEVIFVAKLQHRNLVKLLGCCIQGEEKMLIYEYMPNRSLDTVLFDPKTGKYLDWSTRFHIVKGIARGLMYIHEDSRLTVIHRDLKASNVLLDYEMNPKISDFGIAKRCQGNEIDVTRRVVGTYGYMSPEYAICGRFSVKSDVFSFGVIVLEIVSGKRNTSYYPGGCHFNLLTHAWSLHKEGRSVELVDSHLEELDRLEQVQRLIHIGLLCVQQHPQDRPYMTSVVAMLNNDSKLPEPNQPGFFMESLASSNVNACSKSSLNEMTITMVGGR